MLAVTATVMAQTDFRHISFAEAQKAAQQEKKLIFVDFYTSWCGPCKNMANNVFPLKHVGDFMNAKFVCVKYDAEKEELDLVNRAKITAYPTFVIYNPDGTEVNRKVGGGTPDAFIADMERLSNTELTPEKIRARYDAGERSATLIKAYAALLKEEAYNSRGERQGKMMKISDLIADYFDNLSDKERLSADNLFLYREHCTTTADKKMQYLFTNKGKADKSLRPDIDSLLTKAYTQEAAVRAGFYEKLSQEAYPLFREQAMSLPAFKEEKYQGFIEVCDAYATGDMNKYLDSVEKMSRTKCKDNAFTLLYGLAEGLSGAEKDLKMRAAKLIRSSLNTMPGTNISFLGSTIADLEGERK